MRLGLRFRMETNKCYIYIFLKMYCRIKTKNAICETCLLFIFI